jgi:hypothetical protein
VLAIGITAAVLAAFGADAIYVQDKFDKYSLKSL